MSLLRREARDPVVTAAEERSNATLNAVALLTQQVHLQLVEFERVAEDIAKTKLPELERNTR